MKTTIAGMLLHAMREHNGRQDESSIGIYLTTIASIMGQYVRITGEIGEMTVGDIKQVVDISPRFSNNIIYIGRRKLIVEMQLRFPVPFLAGRSLDYIGFRSLDLEKDGFYARIRKPDRVDYEVAEVNVDLLSTR